MLQVVWQRFDFIDLTFLYVSCSSSSYLCCYIYYADIDFHRCSLRELYFFFRLANSIVEQWNRVIWINFVSNYSNSVLNFKTNHRDSWQPKNSQNTIKWVESEKRQKWIGYQQNQKPVYMAHVTYMDGYDEKKVIFIVEDRVISTAVWYEFQSNICIT